MPKSKSTARSHDESRAAVCIVCFKKSKQKCTDDIRKILTDPEKNSNPIFSSILIHDERVPSGICKTCLADVFSLNSSNEKELKFPPGLDIKRDISIFPLCCIPKCQGL